MRAYLKNNRQAPRKVRLVANAVRGKSVDRALLELTFMSQKAAGTLRKLIESAAANARQADAQLKDDMLVIDRITVDKGLTFVRYMPRAFGRASPINKESSHVQVTLAVSDKKTIAPAATKKTTKKASVKNEKKQDAIK